MQMNRLLKDLRKSDGYDTYCAVVYADEEAEHKEQNHTRKRR